MVTYPKRPATKNSQSEAAHLSTFDSPFEGVGPSADTKKNVPHSVEVPPPGKLVFAHRGANRLAPENTMQAFKAAVASGATWLETDVDILPDGTIILIHDDTLDRTTDQRGTIYGLTQEDLGRVDAGAWFSEDHAGEPIPTIEQFVRFLNEAQANVNLELKRHTGTGPTGSGQTDNAPAGSSQPGADAGKQRLVEGVVQALDILHPDRQVIVSSFAHDQLERMAALAPTLTYAPLWEGEPNPDEWVREAARLQAPFVHVEDAGLEERHIRQVTDQGIGVNVWTVNDPARAKTLFDWGVTGVFTDNHEMLSPSWLAAL